MLPVSSGTIPALNTHGESIDLARSWSAVQRRERGRVAAILYTVVRTCERLGIDPFEYLADVLPKLSDQAVNRGKGHLDTLTPMAWSTTKPA